MYRVIRGSAHLIDPIGQGSLFPLGNPFRRTNEQCGYSFR
jgi:hypothetical protein